MEVTLYHNSICHIKTFQYLLYYITIYLLQVPAGRMKMVYMNPVLLKPVNELGSQVIVNGKPVCNMKAKDYFKYKIKLVPGIMEAFQALPPAGFYLHLT